MQNVVIAQPYEFVPPHRSWFWWHLFRPILPWQLRKTAGIHRIEFHGVDRLHASLAEHHGIILTPNHCRPCDPMLIGALSMEINRPLYIMASWHLFMQSRIRRFLLPRLGVFSIYREGTDREALKQAIQLAAEAERPLVIFPEGVISRHNDRLNSLMEGTALIARGAAKQRASETPPGKVVVHPVAIRYYFEGSVEQAVPEVLRDIEHHLTWRPHDDMSLPERIEKIGNALLAMKEIEYFGSPQPGDLRNRLGKFIDHLLVPLEEEWLKGRREKEVVSRVKLLRTAILPEMINGKLEEPERRRRWRQLRDLYFAQQLACYPPGYLGANPSPERLIETVERFEEDLTDQARIHSPMRAVVSVGEAIPVTPERNRSPEGDPLMTAIREQLETMLQI